MSIIAKEVENVNGTASALAVDALPPAPLDEPGSLSHAAAEAFKTFSPTGITVPATLALPEWAELVATLGRLNEGCRWASGDLLLAIGRNNYPEEHAQYLDLLQLSHHGMQNRRWLARAFPRHRRREGLSMSHHEVVASMPPDDQDRWLRNAEVHGWSRDELRAQVRISRDLRERSGGQDAPADDDLPLDGNPEYDGLTVREPLPDRCPNCNFDLRNRG